MLHDDQIVLVNRLSGIPNENNVTSEIFVGGNPFTVALFDSAGLTVTAGLTIQFNNANLLDASKAHHSINPINAALQSSNDVFVAAGVNVGGSLSQTSASSDVFNTYWVDVPDAVVDVAGGVSAYVGSASCRYIRIKYAPAVGVTGLPETFSAIVYHKGLSQR